MKKHSFFLALFFFLTSASYAQSVYEVEYFFKIGNEREDYKALIFSNGDGTGFIRTRFYSIDTKTEMLIDMDMQESFGHDKDGNIEYDKKLFQGKNPYVLTGDTSFHYSPDLFWFVVNVETGYLEPWGVVVMVDDVQYDGEYKKITLLEDKDFTKEFVAQYFTEADEIYKNLFNTTVRGTTPQQKNTNLYLITVANTEADKIGPTCDMDRKSMYKIFSKIARNLEIGFVPKEIYGKDYNRDNVVKAINDLRPGKDDIVIFYYSGHGFSKDFDSRLFPYMDLRHDEDEPMTEKTQMNIEEVYDIIKKKKARLNLVLSDCCNWRANLTNMISPPVASQRSSSLGWSLENVKALFLNPEPYSLLMTAASKGELSAGNLNDGGFFTSTFKETLQKYVGINTGYQNAVWNNVLSNAQTQTKELAESIICPSPTVRGQYAACKQTPMYKTN